MKEQNLLTILRKRYSKAKIEIKTFNEDIVTTSVQADEEKERWLMHMLYRDGESSTSLEEKYDDYPPLETPTETDHEKLQEKIKQSKEDLERAEQIIENELK